MIKDFVAYLVERLEAEKASDPIEADIAEPNRNWDIVAKAKVEEIVARVDK